MRKTIAGRMNMRLPEGSLMWFHRFWVGPSFSQPMSRDLYLGLSATRDVLCLDYLKGDLAVVILESADCYIHAHSRFLRL